MPVRLGPRPGQAEAGPSNYNRISAGRAFGMAFLNRRFPAYLSARSVHSTSPGNADQVRRGILTNSANYFSLHSDIQLKRRATRSPW